jgi:hypothetical protein
MAKPLKTKEHFIELRATGMTLAKVSTALTLRKNV